MDVSLVDLPQVDFLLTLFILQREVRVMSLIKKPRSYYIVIGREQANLSFALQWKLTRALSRFCQSCNKWVIV